jgi:hypothetical protein
MGKKLRLAGDDSLGPSSSIYIATSGDAVIKAGRLSNLSDTSVHKGKTYADTLYSQLNHDSGHFTKPSNLSKVNTELSKSLQSSKKLEIR